MIVLEDLLQGSEEWLDARKCKATASEFKNIITSTGNLSKSCEDYIRELASQSISEEIFPFIGNRHTDHGHEFEPIAREMFIQRTGFDVAEVGMCLPDNHAPISCSPDGLLVVDGEYVGGLEIKCPTSLRKASKHKIDGTLPAEYKAQVHGSLAVTGLPYWYFMSYYPGLEPLILKVERDEFTDRIGEALDEFVIEYASKFKNYVEILTPIEDREVVEESEDVEDLL